MMNKRYLDVRYLLFIIAIVLALGFFHLAWAAPPEIYSITPDMGINDEVEVTMDLPVGWSMISLPITPGVATVTNLFPDAVVVYKYEKETGYVQVQAGESLKVGRGYWILLNNPQSYIIRGMAIPEYMIPVADGWYMIGGCTLPAQKMVISGKMDVVYGYKQGVGYERMPRSKPLERGKGYWILFSDTSEWAAFTASDQSGLTIADQVSGEVAYVDFQTKWTDIF